MGNESGTERSYPGDSITNHVYVTSKDEGCIHGGTQVSSGNRQVDACMDTFQYTINDFISAKGGVSAGDSHCGFSCTSYPTGSDNDSYSYSCHHSYSADKECNINKAFISYNSINNIDQKALSELNKPENKDRKWAYDYMFHLHYQHTDNPNHGAFPIIQKAHHHAINKGSDNFVNFIEGLVCQGINDPSHQYHFVFAAAHEYALKNHHNKLPLTQSNSEKWARNYMDCLVNQGANNSSHPAYYLFSNAHTYALSKHSDTSKSFFAHYMDSLVNQGANNPQHPHYYMFANAHAYALKNQEK